MHTVNHCSCRKVRRSVAPGLLICMALAALVLPFRAHAQLTGSASASGQYENNSNVFALETGYGQPGTGGARSSTTDFVYGASFNGAYQWSRQQLYASASFKQYDYQQFSDLNHKEYQVDTGLIWQLGDLLDGKVDVARARSMVPFLDLTGSVLAVSLLTQQAETFEIGLKLGSEWKLDGTAHTSKTTQPTPEEPNVQLTENSGTTSLEYQGFGPLTSGLTATYLSGEYSGANGTTPSYTQSTAGLLAHYMLTRTSFEGQITYSRRKTSDNGDASASGLTGLLSFNDQLTPKTSFSIKIDRAINTYFLNLGSEIDSDAAANVNWQATYKLSVSLGYTFTYREFPVLGQGSGGAFPVDYQQVAGLSMSYQPRRWLTIGPYANYQTRSSNVGGRNFNATSYGVSVSATVGEPPKAKAR
jgi:hypothetical protein